MAYFRVFCTLPFQNEAKLENVDVINFLNLQDIDDGEGHVYVDRDDFFEHFVKTEWSNLLVVVFLCWDGINFPLLEEYKDKIKC